MRSGGRVRLDSILWVLLLLTLLVAGLGVGYTWSQAATIRSLYGENLLAASYLSDAERGLWEQRFALPNYVLAGAEGRKAIRQAADGFSRQVELNMSAYAALPLSAGEQRGLDEWRQSYAHYTDKKPQYFALVDAGNIEEALAYRAKETNPAAAEAVRAISLLIDAQRRIGAQRAVSARAGALQVTMMLSVLVLLSVAVFVALVVVLRRTIFGAVARMRGSSAKLTTAATQQLVGAKDLAVGAVQIGASMRELMDMAQQIGAISDQVLQVAEKTQASASEGSATVNRARKTILGIQQQEALLERQMLELGEKSKQISGVLALIDEFSERTNILSINASIEAAAAGEFGRRFAVIADEVRKLAQRVSGSTREIRSLVAGVQGATDGTVSVIEGGARAVEVGVQDFAAVLMAFSHVTEQIAMTVQAVRAIKLSTLEQIASVKEVNRGMEEIQRATTDLEAASGQTLQTSGALFKVSDGLAEVMRRRATESPG